jgi:cell wall-associated NlpC family hydrolase
MTVGALIEQARTWVGVPFLHQGRTREGVDCVGLLVAVLREVGYQPIDSLNYTFRAKSDVLMQHLATECDQQPVGAQQPGDVLVFSMRGEAPYHVGLLTERGTIIHALGIAGKVVEHQYDASWQQRTRRVYRWRPVA